MSTKRKSVLIIGAGISGLAAAHSLHENGFDVQIFEARKEFGGRIRKDDQFAGFTLEVGGEEIHKVNSPYYHLALKMGADLKPDDTLNHYFEDIEKEELMDREEFLSKYNDQYFYNEVVQNRDIQDDSQSLQNFFSKKGLKSQFYQWYEAFWGIENGGSLNEISVKAYGDYESGRKSDHDLNFILMNTSHYEIIEKAFASVLPFIHYSTPITEINYFGEKEFPVDREQEDEDEDDEEEDCKGKDFNRVVIFDKQGNRYEGDYIIVTVPISQLQNKTIRFNPELPPQKQDAIRRMKLGRGGKIHFKFKNRFWPDNARTLFLRSKISFLWNQYHEQKDTDEIQTNVLAGLLAGDVMDEMQDPEKRQALIEEVLEKMARVFKYPKVKEELLDVMWNDFTNFEYIQGNYSMPTLNIGSSRYIYQQPVDNILFFAGEASHTTDSMTIHGAYETGLRDAQRIIELQKEKK
ncbi:hypothetical protein ABPG74_015831 [Tetrahymena malaccensis]